MEETCTESRDHEFESRCRILGWLFAEKIVFIVWKIVNKQKIGQMLQTCLILWKVIR